MDPPVGKTIQKNDLISGNILIRLRYYYRKWSRNYTDYGFWVSWKKFIAYLYRPLYQKIIYYLYELNLDQYIGSMTRESKYVFRMLDPAETHLIDQIEAMEEWLKGTFRKKLQDNCLCMVVLDGETVAGFNYVAIGEAYIPLLKLRILTGPTEAWSEQITISSDYRRQGLGGLLRSHFYRELKARGITALYGHRQEFNVASKQSARKFTAGIMVRAVYRRILGFHRLICVKADAGGPDAGIPFSIHRSPRPSGTDATQASPISPPARFTAYIEDLK